ncbi:MAG: cytochrome c biogenesis protein ResB [Propionibacteriaceae bacterium]|jgi:cytochrome c biogenesis protein|nr:cytochrome c biogenesis protein ResB [Propionibacteriaceae bacterium]
MAQDTAPVQQDSEEEGSELSLGDLLHNLYAITYSKTVGLAIILVVAGLVLIGVLIGQASDSDYATADAKAAFLTQATAKYGGWASVLDFLGFFRIFSSPIFLVAIAALCVSIIGCTTHRIPQLWRRFRSPRVDVGDRLFAAARYRGEFESTLPDGQTAELLADKLKQGHYRVIRGKTATLYADKYAWGGFGTVVAHLSFLVILAAFVVTALTGFETTLNLPAGGDAVAVGHGTNLAVQATSFNSKFSDDGRPLDYVSHLVLTDNGQKVAEQDVRVNEPLAYGGLRFHQASYGLAADISASDTSGNKLLDTTVPMQWQTSDGTMSVGEFELAERGITVDVYLAASGVSDSTLEAGQAMFQIIRDGQAEDMQVADQGTPITIGDLSLTFVRERQFTGITVRKDPGAWLMWIGSILLVVGMGATFMFRQRRVWIRVKDRKAQFASVDKEDSGFRRNFEELVDQAKSWTGDREAVKAAKEDDDG